MRSKVSLHTDCPFSTMKGTSCARTSSAAREPLERAAGVESEAGVEEAGVVGAQLAAGRVVRRHLGGQVRRDAHRLVGHQEVEALGRQHEAVARPRGTPGPRTGAGRPRAPGGEVEQRRAVAGAVADPARARRRAGRARGRGRRESTSSSTGTGCAVAEEHRARSQMRRPHLVVGQPAAGPIERRSWLSVRSSLHPDGERQRHHLEVERSAGSPAAISSKRSLSSVMTRVNTSMRPVELFGLALPRSPAGRSRRSFSSIRYGQRPRAWRRRRAGRSRRGRSPSACAPPSRLAGQEAAADAQRPLAQAQVEAGRLDVGLGDLEAPGVDVAGPDGPLEQLAGEDALRRWAGGSAPAAWRARPQSKAQAQDGAEGRNVGTASGTACG